MRLNHVGVVLENSSILIMGGRDMDTKTRLRSTAILNLYEGHPHFRSGPDMKDVRSGAAVTWLLGEVTVCGGVEGLGPRCPLSTCEVLRGGSEWRRMEPMLESRGGLALAALAGKMYAMGGESWQGHCNDREFYTVFKSVEKYDPDTKKWEPQAEMKEARFLHNSAVFQGRIFVCGGARVDKSVVQDCEAYNPNDNTWKVVASLIHPRFGFGMAVLDSQLYAVGGSSVPYNKRKFHKEDTTLYSIERLSNPDGPWAEVLCGLRAQTYAPSVTAISDKEYRTLKQIQIDATADASTQLPAALSLPSNYRFPFLFSLTTNRRRLSHAQYFHHDCPFSLTLYGCRMYSISFFSIRVL